MSTSTEAQAPQLQTTTTFLPILDDLLSPDFRPVTYPPVITPLQTPTTNVPSSNTGGNVNGAPISEAPISKDNAAVKIQKWWKNSKQKSLDVGDGDFRHERVKHTLRHRRAEEHIRALESELTRLKQQLTTERKLRSLQYEAIRSLWSQVQKLSLNNPDSTPPIMTQSLPNGLPLNTHCHCTTEMTTIAHKLETEIQELRSLLMQALPAQDCGMESSTSSGSTKVNKRPDSLDLNGGGGGKGVNAKPEEIQGYASEMAKFVVERGISDNVDGDK